MELIQAQHLLPQRKIPLHGGQTAVNGLHQGIIDGHRHVVGKQALVQGGFIAPDLGKVVVQLHLAGIGGSEGVKIALELIVIGLEGVLPHGTALTVPVQAVGAVAQGQHLPIFPGELREGHIHALQHGKGIVGSTGSIGKLGEHLLLGLRQGVVPGPGGVLQNVPVLFEHGVRQPFIEGLLGNGQNLRIQKAQYGGQLHIQIGGPAIQILRLRVAVVAALKKHGVDIEEAHRLNDGIDLIQARLQAFLGGLQSAGQGTQGLYALLCLCIGLLPGRLVGINIRKFPLKLRVHFIAVFQCHRTCFLSEFKVLRVLYHI